MDDILKNALAETPEPKTAPKGAKNGDVKLHGAGVKIKIIGVGGAGTNTVNRLKKMGIDSAETIAINTDANHLKMVEASRKILIGAQANGSRVGRSVRDRIYGRDANDLDLLVEAIAECPVEEVRRAAQEIIDPDHRFQVTLGP